MYYTVKLGTETWFTFFVLLTVVCFAKFADTRLTRRRDVILGVSMGLCMLNKSVAILLPIVLFGLALVFNKSYRRQLSHSLAVLIVAVAMSTPWTLRNYAVSGAFVPVQTLTWWNFWYDFDVKMAADSWSAHQPPGKEIVTSKYPAWGGHPYGLRAGVDVQQERHLANLALQWAIDRPVDFVRKTVRNLGEFWYLVESWSKAKVVIGWQLIQLPFVLVGLYSTFKSVEKRWLGAICISIILYFNLIYAPIFSGFRYSLTVVPYVSILMALGSDAIYRWATRQAAPTAGTV